VKCRSCGAGSRVLRVDEPPKYDVPEGNVARVRQCRSCAIRWRTLEVRASEDDFVEVFKHIKSKKRAPA